MDINFYILTLDLFLFQGVSKKFQPGFPVSEFNWGINKQTYKWLKGVLIYVVFGRIETIAGAD